LLLTSPPAFAQFINSNNQNNEFSHQQARLAMQDGNYAVAYCIWQPMARNGDNIAQYNLGWMYHNGYGLSINDENALYWWLKAASTGSADAHFALGDLYANGQGVEKNMAIALGWYISAALKNHIPARETLLELMTSEDKFAVRTFELLLQSDWSLLGETMEISVDKANLRSGPDKSYKVVTTLKLGHVLIPLKQQNGWTQVGITGQGRTAWIFSRLIRKPAGIYPLKPAK
jgi:TPR repeat protein